MTQPTLPFNNLDDLEASAREALREVGKHKQRALELAAENGKLKAKITELEATMRLCLSIIARP